MIGLWFAVSKLPIVDTKKVLDGIVWVFAPQLKDYRTDTSSADPINNNITKIFKSSIVSRRISAQSGVFTCHKIMETDKFVVFENHKTYKKLLRIYIKGEDFPDIRKQLNMLGINNASVFPDIDGFCQHLEWKYS